MRKSFILTVIIAGISSGCSSVQTIKSKLADATLMKKQLANGQLVHVGNNLSPTKAWNCYEVGKRQSYVWSKMKTEAPFHFKAAEIYVADKAINYANAHHLKLNYINLQIPKVTTFTKSSGRFSDEANLHPYAPVYAVFYQCKKINPEHKIGIEKSMNYEVRVGD